MFIVLYSVVQLPNPNMNKISKMDQVSILIKLNLIVFSGLNNNIIKRLLLHEKLKIMVSFWFSARYAGNP